MINMDLATDVFLEYFLNNFEEQIWVGSSFFSYTQYFSLLIPEVQPVLNMVIPLHTRGRWALVELIIIEQFNCSKSMLVSFEIFYIHFYVYMAFNITWEWLKQKHALVKKKSAPIPKQTNNLAEG